MNYPGIRIEGAILSPDVLDRLTTYKDKNLPTSASTLLLR